MLEQHFYTPAEVASLFKLNILTVYGYIKDGRISAVRFGRKYRIGEKSLKHFLEENQT